MGGEKRNVYVTVAFAGVAMMVAMLVGVVVMRRRSSRYPQHQVKFYFLQQSCDLMHSYTRILFSTHHTNTFKQLVWNTHL